MDREKAVHDESGRVLRLHMEGLDDLAGDVRLGAFIDKLSSLKAALSETEHLLTKASAGKIDFLVSELSHNSPAMVGLRGVEAKDCQISAGKVMEELASFVKQVRSGTVAASAENAKLVGHLKKLVSGVGERFSRIWIDGTGLPTVLLDHEVEKALEDALPDTRREIGDIKGVVKLYSGVGKQKYFKIVPPAGGVEIKCLFPLALQAKAAEAVERSATIDGELKYFEDEFWPYEVLVRDIHVHPHNDSLPSLAGLKGTETDACEGLSAADFVRELRSGW